MSETEQLFWRKVDREYPDTCALSSLTIAVLALRKIQQREWSAADYFKAACHAAEMWEIADHALDSLEIAGEAGA